MTDRQSIPFVNPPEILYRLKGVSGDLLYVGVTRDWPMRMTQHQRDKGWWDEVRAVELVYVDGTRAQIEAIERAVIKTEAPRFNKQHNAEVRRGLAAPAPVVVEPQDDRPVYAVGDKVRCRGAMGLPGVGTIAERIRSINMVQFDGQDYLWSLCDNEIIHVTEHDKSERQEIIEHYSEYGPEWHCWSTVGYQQGWLVEHPEYGEGWVLSCDDDPIHGDVHIRFYEDTQPERHLSIQWAPLRTVAK